MRPPDQVTRVGLSARFLTLDLCHFGMNMHERTRAAAPGSTSPRDYGAGTLIIGVLAPVTMAVLAVPVWIMLFNV